jgi:hypothetical protein
MKNKFIILVSFSIITSCSIISIGKQGVYYNEMRKIPEITIFDNKIVINTDNSDKASALLIYKIKTNIDTADKEIEISALQAAGKKYRNKFDIKIKGFSRQQLIGYKYYWIDPDRRIYRLYKIK